MAPNMAESSSCATRTLLCNAAGSNWGWDHNSEGHPKAVVADAEQQLRDRKFGSHLIATDVGQNFVEVWQLKSGGGWVHPVRRSLNAAALLHIHYFKSPALPFGFMLATLSCTSHMLYLLCSTHLVSLSWDALSLLMC